jgi:fructose-specific phosphotransferase system IIC component
MNFPDFPFAPSLFERYIVGSAAPFIATAISFLPELEAWLRITALIVGILVSGLSFASAEAEKRRNRKTKNKEDKE